MTCNKYSILNVYTLASNGCYNYVSYTLIVQNTHLYNLTILTVSMGYRKQEKIYWAKLSRFSWFSRAPRKFSVTISASLK